MSKIKNANKKIENAVVGGYQKIENAAVSGYKKVENSFINAFLAEDGETTEQARARIIGYPRTQSDENTGGRSN